MFAVLFGLSLAMTGCGGGTASLDNPKDAASRPSEAEFKKMHDEAQREPEQPREKQ
jgi:hypothetical protein